MFFARLGDELIAAGARLPGHVGESADSALPAGQADSAEDASPSRRRSFSRLFRKKQGNDHVVFQRCTSRFRSRETWQRFEGTTQ